jgi:hypothetical protein
MEERPNRRSSWLEAGGPGRPRSPNGPNGPDGDDRTARAAVAERAAASAGRLLTEVRARAPAAERPIALPGTAVLARLPAPATHLPSLPWGRVFWVIAGLLLFTRAIALAGTAASGGSVREAILRWGGTWDAGWYGSIVQFGYGHSPPGIYATGFYPGWPLLGGLPYQAVSLAGRLIGHPLVDPHDLRCVSLVLMANACLAIAVWALWHLYAPLLGRGATLGGIALLLAAPGGFWLSAGYSESSFIAASALAFLCAHRRRWLLAGLAVGAAAVIRPYGVALFLPLAILWLRGDRRVTPALVAGVALGLVGGGLYPVYTLLAYGNPLLYLEVHRNPAAFGGVTQATDPLSTMRVQWRRVREGLRLLGGPAAAAPGGAAAQGSALIVIAAGVFEAGVGAVVSVVLVPAAHLLWAALMLIIPLTSSAEHASLARFALAAFPAYFALARLLHRWPAVLGVTVGVSCMAMSVLAYGFARFLVG